MLKKFLLLICLCTFNYSFSQFYYFYNGGSGSDVNGFKYQDNYYDVNPKGLKLFTSETTMSDEMRTELSKQLKKISTNNTIANVALYGGFGIGAGIMINEALSKENGEQFKSSTLFTGLGVFALGGIINLIVGPKKKDYYNFINTFNKGTSEDKINIALKIDYSQQMNCGIAITF